MDFKKIILAAIIFMFWSVLIGYLVSFLIPYAIIISALVAGIYAGFKTNMSKGIFNGFFAGLIGGIILGSLSSFVPSVYNIPLSVSTSSISPMADFATANFNLFVIPTLAFAGCIFGTIGGFMGSINQLKKIFLFLTLFILFLFYAALDNAAWWWGRASWNWSLSVVLVHWVDISVALVFALAVIILSHFLKIL